METKPPSLKSILETMIFVSGKTLGSSDMLEALNAFEGDGPKPSRQELEEALASLQKEWEEREGGVRLIKVAQGYEFRSIPEFSQWIRLLNRPKPQRLSMPAVETLAMIAYRQPITRTEIEAVRGVDSGGVLKSLTDRKLIKIVGRKEEPGRPILYATTKEFLEFFGLKDLADLPPLQEFEDRLKAEAENAPQPSADLSVADLVSTPEELGSMEESDREALEELDSSLKNLKDVDKNAAATINPAAPEPQPQEKLES